VIGLLRFVGLLNAAVWLGATVFLTFGAEPALFSEEARGLLQKSHFYLSEMLVQAVRTRYYYLSVLCGSAALLHVFAEWLYLGRAARRFTLWLLVGLLALVVVSGVWLQPRLKRLHNARTLGATPAERQAAEQSFQSSRRVGLVLDLLIMAGVAAHLWRLGNPPDKLRFLDAAQIRS
jgi:hypothetical protein